MQLKGFKEKYPEAVTSNPGGSQDPLGESILDAEQPALRVFEPTDTRLVIGRNQDPYRECIVENAQKDAVPIHRRVSGGGAVVLCPGTVVVALRQERVEQCPIDQLFCQMNKRMAPAIAELTGQKPTTRGHGDLAMRCEDGQERKILGASLRQSRDTVYYLGVFLVGDVVQQMERYLQSPSREPDYRKQRGHRDFCTKLEDWGVTVEALKDALSLACH